MSLCNRSILHRVNRSSFQRNVLIVLVYDLLQQSKSVWKSLCGIQYYRMFMIRRGTVPSFTPHLSSALIACALTAAILCGGSLLAMYLEEDRKSTRLNSSHVSISYAVFCLKKKKLLL